MNRSPQAETNLPNAPLATRRVVLLGASNLTKGIGTVLQTAYGVWGKPLQVFAALGHGRSYGQTSRLFGLQMPGILECGLWSELTRLPSVPTAVLVTDIGNDLLYEVPVERITAWVEQCLDRLSALQARCVVTLLPVENLQTLSVARFLLMRKLFYPRSQIGLQAVSQRAHALDEQVRRLATERGFTLARHRAAWYGFDPIHIRIRHRPAAWREILASWSSSPEMTISSGNSPFRTLYLRSRVPERRRILGFEQRGCQPSGRLKDGTTVAIY